MLGGLHFEGLKLAIKLVCVILECFGKAFVSMHLFVLDAVKWIYNEALFSVAKYF